LKIRRNIIVLIQIKSNKLENQFLLYAEMMNFMRRSSQEHLIINSISIQKIFLFVNICRNII